MSYKCSILILSFACMASLYSFSQQDTIREANSEPTSTIVSTLDTVLTNDSIIVIHTVCAPICSSHARIYNKEWQEIGILKPPFQSAFPEAYIENGQILWRDNDNFDYTPAP